MLVVAVSKMQPHACPTVAALTIPAGQAGTHNQHLRRVQESESSNGDDAPNGTYHKEFLLVLPLLKKEEPC